MTRAQALKEAKKRWSGFGCNPCIRDKREASSQTKRDAVMAELVAEFGPIPEGDDALSRGARRDWWAKANKHPRCHERYYRRYSVGYTDNIFGAFHVRGEGDTWAEAFERAK